MKKYEKYKDSGIEWIGEIPEHWDVKKIKHLTKLQGGYAFKSDLFSTEGTPIIRIGDISTNINFDECKKTDDDTIPKEYWLDQYDTLIALSGATTGKTCFVNNIPPKAYINQRVARIMFSNKFLYYVVNSGFFQEQILLTASGSAQENISNSQIENLEISISNTPEEQTAIANYLDRKTSEIDELIADKKRLLELYEEEKTAIINQAVTKGIYPNEPMKDSGIEWLGEIPEHWDSVSLKWVSKIYSGGTPSKNNSEYWVDGTIPWLNSGTVNQGDITEPSEYITEEALNNSSAKWIPEKALVMALAGQGKTKGMVAQVQFKTTCNQSLGVIVPNEKINNRFLMYWLRKNYQNIRNLGGGDKRDGINLEMIGGIPLPLPTYVEQTKIVEHVESKSLELIKKQGKTKKLIDLLTEYRTALISEVVTGKIKVTE